MPDPHRDAPPRLPLTLYLRLGVRNLWRHPQRTLLSLASLVVGVAVITFLGAISDGLLRAMHDNFVLTSMGQIQIHARGHAQSGRIRDYLPDPRPLYQTLDDTPGIRAWSPRLQASGLATQGSASAGVTLLGIAPGREQAVTRLLRKVSPGGCLRGERELILGQTVAATLDGRPGDWIVLTGETPAGELVSERFRLCGILATGAPQLDRLLALLPLQTAQRWLRSGAGITHVAVRLEEGIAAAPLAGELRRRLASQPVAVWTWRQLDPMVDQWLRFGALYGVIVLGIVVALSVTQVGNTQLMALHERTRELGLMQALGTRPRQLFLMIAWESALLVGLGGALGYASGVLAVVLSADRGIDFSRFSGALHFFFMDPVVHPLLTAATGTRILAALALAALLGGLYPSWRAMRLDPLEALR